VPAEARRPDGLRDAEGVRRRRRLHGRRKSGLQRRPQQRGALEGLSLYGLLDRQKGGMLAAGTWRHFDLGQNSRDYDDPGPDPTKTLGKWRTDTYLRMTRIYYQDVSYWKLREITLGYDVPSSILHRALGGAESARLTLSGRNLKTWTNFRGGDPDFSNFGGTPDAVQRNRELGAYPPSRHFWVNLQVGF